MHRLSVLSALLVLVGCAWWLLDRGEPEAVRGLERRTEAGAGQALVGGEASPAEGWVPAEDSSTAESRDLGGARRDLAAPPEKGERDELFADSPARPEPGHYEVPFLQEFYEDGTLSFEAEQARNPNGVWLLHGLWTSWHENGQKLEQGRYDWNREDGLWQWWDENGQEIARGSFLQGKREGAWTFWYSSGAKQVDAYYVDGEGQGLWTTYYEDGGKNAQGHFVDGEISGYWTIWDEFGEVNGERTGHYEAGERVSD